MRATRLGEEGQRDETPLGVGRVEQGRRLGAGQLLVAVRLGPEGQRGLDGGAGAQGVRAALLVGEEGGAGGQQGP